MHVAKGWAGALGAVSAGQVQSRSPGAVTSVVRRPAATSLPPGPSVLVTQPGPAWTGTGTLAVRLAGRYLRTAAGSHRRGRLFSPSSMLRDSSNEMSGSISYTGMRLCHSS